MTYRSWHLITIRSIATSWAFAAKIISMINTPMSFGARLIGAEINLKQEEQEVKTHTNRSILCVYSVGRARANQSYIEKASASLRIQKFICLSTSLLLAELPTNTQHTVEGFSPLICKHCI